jgi:hypothetical protein
MQCTSANDDGAVDQRPRRLRPPSWRPSNLSWLPTGSHVQRSPHLWCLWRRGWSPTLPRRRRASLLGREGQLGWLQSLSPARSVVSWVVSGLYVIERVRFIPGHSFWRCGQGSHVLASYRQLCCHGELVGLEDVSQITFENALYNFRAICDSMQASRVVVIVRPSLWQKLNPFGEYPVIDIGPVRGRKLLHLRPISHSS